MRSSTKTFVASVGLGVCALSYAIGANSATGSSLVANGIPTASDSNAPTNQASASASTSSSASASAANTNGSSSGTSAKPTKKPTKKPAASGASSDPASSKSTGPAPAPSKSTAPAPAPSKSTPPASSSVTKTGDVFTERQYRGKVQVIVTKTNGKVSSVEFAVATATDGRAGAFPYLAQMAVASNGAAVSNVTNATYTTDTFNLALASAMSKF